MIGGVIAAPIAAWLVRKIPSIILGVLVGGLIIITNLNTIFETFQIISDSIKSIIYIFFALIWMSSILYNIMRYRNQ